MDMVLLRLSPGPKARARALKPEIVADILWAVTISDDHIEHVRAQRGTAPGSVDLVLSQRTGTGAAAAALDLCLRAICGSPALAGWRVQLIQPPDVTTEIVNAAYGGVRSPNPNFELSPKTES